MNGIPKAFPRRGRLLAAAQLYKSLFIDPFKQQCAYIFNLYVIIVNIYGDYDSDFNLNKVQ